MRMTVEAALPAVTAVVLLVSRSLRGRIRTMTRTASSLLEVVVVVVVSSGAGGVDVDDDDDDMDGDDDEPTFICSVVFDFSMLPVVAAAPRLKLEERTGLGARGMPVFGACEDVVNGNSMC